MAQQQLQHTNRLLRLLPDDVLALIEPHLERVTLEQGEELVAPNRSIKQIYFLESGVASIVTLSFAGDITEVGLFGRDGLSGTAILLGTDRSPQRSFMQVSGGVALRIGSQLLLDAVDRSPPLRRLLLRYIATLMVQSANNTAANAHLQMEARLARYLLMCHDRMSGDDIHVTHEFMAMMIASQRTGVTLALHKLEGEHAIRSMRGLVEVRDRSRLEELAGEAYGPSEAEYERLIGPLRHPPEIALNAFGAPPASDIAALAK